MLTRRLNYVQVSRRIDLLRVDVQCLYLIDLTSD